MDDELIVQLFAWESLQITLQLQCLVDAFCLCAILDQGKDLDDDRSCNYKVLVP